MTKMRMTMNITMKENKQMTEYMTDKYEGKTCDMCSCVSCWVILSSSILFFICVTLSSSCVSWFLRSVSSCLLDMTSSSWAFKLVSCSSTCARSLATCGSPGPESESGDNDEDFRVWAVWLPVQDTEFIGRHWTLNWYCIWDYLKTLRCLFTLHCYRIQQGPFQNAEMLKNGL